MQNNRKIFSKGVVFIMLLTAAWGVAAVLFTYPLPLWAQIFLVFLATKIFADLALLAVGRRKYYYFEDYIKELLIYSGVAALCTLGIVGISRLLGGSIWVPLPVAVLVALWHK